MSSSSPSPIKRKLQYSSPLRSDRGSDDFDDMPEYIPIESTPRGPRGRYGINEIAQIVGSRRYRDIKRSGNFMPGQFDLWNAKETGGNKQYWGGYQDVDGDGLAHEFVVRRGDKDGQMIAVNGYTTKRSDWAARRKFYEAYPERSSRKDKTVKTFMRDEYYVPEYDPMTGKITKWGIKPGSDEDEFKNNAEWKRYNKYTPRKMSPYQAINKYIFMPALKLYLESINMTQKDYLKQYGGVAVLSRLLSDIYYELVKGPIWSYLHKIKALDDLQAEFIEKKGIDSESPNFNAEFEKFVFSKKDVRKVVKQYVRNTVLPEAGALIETYAGRIEGDRLKEYTPAPSVAGSDDLDI